AGAVGRDRPAAHGVRRRGDLSAAGGEPGGGDRRGGPPAARRQGRGAGQLLVRGDRAAAARRLRADAAAPRLPRTARVRHADAATPRSEERRVGEEGRSEWGPRKVTRGSRTIW